jgi:hypothetical protein
MKDVESKLRGERDRMVAWLQTQVGLKASDMIEDILTGKRFTWPYLAAIWQPIKYETRELLFDRPVRDWYGGPPHLGFVLVWKWGDSKGIDDLLQSAYTNAVQKMYQEIWGRPIDVADLNYYTFLLSTGGTLAAVRADMEALHLQNVVVPVLSSISILLQ